jgi:hypothetical protein
MSYVNNQWYLTDDGRYVQYSDNAAETISGSKAHWRFAGEAYKTVLSKYGEQRIKQDSIIPDFTNSSTGDYCFSAQNGAEQITSKKIISIKKEISVGMRSGLCCTIDGKTYPLHQNPTVFNSFDQFKAYWAEKALGDK